MFMIDYGPHSGAGCHLNWDFPAGFRCRNLRNVIFFDDADAVAIQDSPAVSASGGTLTMAGRLAAGVGAATLMIVAVAAAVAATAVALI